MVTYCFTLLWSKDFCQAHTKVSRVSRVELAVDAEATEAMVMVAMAVTQGGGVESPGGGNDTWAYITFSDDGNTGDNSEGGGGEN